MTVVAAEAAGGAAAAGGGGAAAGRAAAGGVGGQAAGGGLAPAARKPAAGPRGKPGKSGAAGKSGTPGKTGKSGSMFDKAGNVEQAVDSGISEARGLTLTPPKRLTVNDGAGFLGGLLIYILALNYLRYGRAGVKGWLGAKFVNRPWTPPDDSGADGSSGGGGSRSFGDDGTEET
jgi:hypothetical protein